MSCLHHRRLAPQRVKYPRLLQSHLTRRLMSAVPFPTGDKKDKSQMLVFGHCERGTPPTPHPPVYSKFSKTYQTSFFIKYLLSLPLIVFHTRFTSVIHQTSTKNEGAIRSLYFSSYVFTEQMSISVYLNVSFVCVYVQNLKCTQASATPVFSFLSCGSLQELLMSTQCYSSPNRYLLPRTPYLLAHGRETSDWQTIAKCE